MRMLDIRGWVLAALALLVVSGVVRISAAQVSGKLVLGGYKPAGAESAPRCYWELENGVKEVRADRVDAARDLAVVLTGPADAAPGLDRVEVPFYGGSLLPSTIVVRNGATVLFRNDDEFAHELYAEGLDALVAEATSPRGRRSFQATTAGSWPLRDKVIAHLSGQLIVLTDLVAVATHGADGSFTFPAVKPGKYVLKVFHGASEVASQAVEVGDRALTLDPIALVAAAGAGAGAASPDANPNSSAK